MRKEFMNIGIVCYPTYGGSGVVATELGKALAAKGHQVHFISYKRPARLGSFQTNVYYHEVSTSEYPLFDFKPYDTALTSKIVDVSIHHNLDILHVHYAIPHAIIGFVAREILAKKGKRVPLVTTLHGTDITLVGVDGSFYPVVEFSINESDCVTAVSASLKDDSIRAFNLTRDIEVIPNFVDSTRFKPVDNQFLRCRFVRENEKIISHISNFRKVKRIEDVVKSFFEIDKTIPSKLLLIGDGPERSGLEDLVRELGIEEKVYFLGKQDAVEDLLGITDLFMLTSEHESFGLSALEAMACAVPVVSSNAGGLPEVNVEGYSGFNCPVGNVPAFIHASLKILGSKEKHEQFKSNAFQQSLKFELNKILPMYEKAYWETLDKI